mmetsp:Transcript_17808/g.28825  ORF Transcript_17808/g.28825 Transcript_17808/m.28825 type:complete len:320 (+) Transcript_17808:209-1168(+)|eukprot:CAMPEP_0203765044 /NCGR_PEP_ID=MMETSP0098-20131031/18196_1 /ASSEMBLY_ACC=CAM_ASM_000208 /TAXON_ID=96639 /ORGANISM=" , Strain NY0313808BC1" /LENGTH=319 /DNA_ID=CAMNT_0050661261 /DNA_START=1526 /DNA_END=2485 /DNA_ORIENTATION=-
MNATRKLLVSIGANGNRGKSGAWMEMASKQVAALVADGEYSVALTFGSEGNVNRQVHRHPSILDRSNCKMKAEFSSKLKNALVEIGLNGEMPSLSTHIEVNEDDISLKNPDLQVGKVYSRKAAESLVWQYGWTFVRLPDLETRGRERGESRWRRVISTPKPEGIANQAELEDALDKSKNSIACIDTIRTPIVRGTHETVDGFVSHDAATSVLGNKLKFDAILFSTDFGPNFDLKRLLDSKSDDLQGSAYSVQQVRDYIKQDHISTGLTIRSKLEAAIDFVSPKASTFIKDRRCYFVDTFDFQRVFNHSSDSPCATMIHA